MTATSLKDLSWWEDTQNWALGKEGALRAHVCVERVMDGVAGSCSCGEECALLKLIRVFLRYGIFDSVKDDLASRVEEIQGRFWD